MPNAPVDHPRRCQANLKEGRICQQWAARGSRYCRYHGGHTSKKIRLSVPRFYSNRLGGTLKKLVERGLRASPAKQLSLLEELAVTRAMCSEAVAMYMGAEQTGKDTIKAAAAALMAEQLDNVRRMCESAARVYQMNEAFVSAHNIDFVVRQVCKIVYEVLGDEGHEQAEAIEEALSEELLVDSGGAQGTRITPDADVVAMIETVPSGPEDA